MKREFIGFTKIGSDKDPGVNLVQKELFKQAIRDLGEGVKIKLTIENYRKKRSLSQNGLWHKLIDIIAKETGMPKEGLKEVLKQKFIKEEPLRDVDGNEVVDEETGEVLSYRPGSSDLKTDEMMVLIDETYEWAKDFLGIILPTVEEMKNNNF